MADADGSRARDAALLSAGTFTALPVPPPARIDHKTASWSLLLAPVWGALIAGLSGLVAVAAQWLVARNSDESALAALLGGVLFVACTAIATRGLHLDGLTDTADGFASMRRGVEALQVMRDPGVGALGVVSLLLVLALQSVTVAVVLERADGAVAVLVLVGVGILSRAPLGWLTRNGTPAADDGLGRAVVGAIPAPVAAAAGAFATVVAGAAIFAWSIPAAVAAAGAAWLTAVLVRRSGLRRFKVVTGDLLGAAVELSLLAALLVVVVL